MNSLEISRFDLMNLLPYSLIEEALEYDLLELSSHFPITRKEKSRISSYIKQSDTKSEFKLESLISNFDFEKEVSEEITKILHSKSLYDALFTSLIESNSINDLLQDAIGKENIYPTLIN